MLLLVAVFFVVRTIAPQTVGEQIRRHALQVLREHYVGLDISIGRARFSPDTGLVIDDLEFSVPIKGALAGNKLDVLFQSRSRELVHIDRLTVVTKTDLERLLDKENPFTTQRVIVQGVTASAWMENDETLSLQRLLPIPKFGDAPSPRIEVRDASLLLETDSSLNVSQQLRPLEVVVSEAVILRHRVTDKGPDSPAKVDGEIDPTASLLASVHEETVPQASHLQTSISLQGGASFADQFDIQISSINSVHQVRAGVTGIRFTNDLVSRLPQKYQHSLAALAGLQLLADTTIQASVAPNQPVNFHARTQIRNGTFLHPKSSIPLKDIRGVVSCDSSGATIETCQAFWGDARLHVKGKTFGYSLPPRAQLSVSASNLMLDQRLAAIVPPKLSVVWDRFEPRGFVDVPQATFDILPDRMDTTATIVCKGVDLRYDKFPYPVQNVSGSMTMRDGRLSSRMISGRVGGQAMQCIFDVPTKAGSTDQRVISISMGGPLTIDSELLQSLSPRGEDATQLETFVRSLNPIGSVQLVQATFRTDELGQKHKEIELNVNDGSLRFSKFPYPLYNVNGNVQVHDRDVTINHFEAANANGGTIRCSGRYLLPAATGVTSGRTPYRTDDDSEGPTMLLDFAASHVAMDEALRSSLPAASQDTWDNLAPSGLLHSLNISMQQTRPGDELDFTIVGQQFDTNRLGADALRLQPSAIPYRLDVTEGMVQFKDGRVRINALRAKHGQSSLSADGSCEQLANGRWLLSINLHSTSKLIPDSELIVALPNEMRGALKGLNLRGPVGFRGRTQTLLPDELHPDPVFAWDDLVLQLEGNRIGDVGPVHALRGEIRVSGKRDASGMRADGEVSIDSMHVNDLQITRVRGPFSIFDERLRLGTTAPDGTPTQPINGRMFDGMIRLDGNVTLSDGSFGVRLALDEAKVPALLAELGHGKSDLTGTLGVNMSLEGLLGTTELLHGRGKATVDNANLYQLPVLVQLLNVLSISATEDVAFTNADIDYTLLEDEIRFDDLNLWGSLIALHGAGTMDRRQELDLSFNTRVSPRNTFTRLFRPLGDQRYTLWTVDVRGPLDDPSIERRSLDAVGQTLERLFPGMNTGAETKRKDRTAGIGRMLQ